MGTIYAYFTIDSDYDNTNQDWDIAWRNDESDEVTSFPAGTKITSVNLKFNQGLHRVSGYGEHEFNVCLEAGAGGGYWDIWNGSTYLSGKGGDGTCDLGYISISHEAGKDLATKGVSDLKVYNTGSSDLYVSSGSTVTAVFTYEYLPTISEFTKLSASTQTNAGKTTVSWSSCTGLNGSGYVTYELKKGSTSLYSGDKTSCTLNVGDIGYGTSTITVYAYYSGESVSREAQVTFYVPSMTAPTLSISSATGMEAELTWTAAKLNYTSGTIQYDIYKDGSLFAEAALSPYPLYKGIVSSWGNDPVTLTIKATATITGNTYSGSTMIQDSNAVTFTYIVTITRCGAPKIVTVKTPLSYGETKLEWSGATDGTENAITGYNVKYRDSADGVTYGGYSEPVFVSASPITVTPPPASGDYRKFYIQTCGAAGSEYYSKDWAESGTLQKDINPAYASFTDSTIYAGSTKPKAVHLTELHDLINALLDFDKKDSMSFSTIAGGQTSLRNWKAHILEIRDAVDQLVPSHSAWVNIPSGLPSAAVVNQIRDILLDYYNER